jgi:hypothetical protein
VDPRPAHLPCVLAEIAVRHAHFKQFRRALIYNSRGGVVITFFGILKGFTDRAEVAKLADALA